MSSSRALCCLLSVKKQKHDFQVCFVDRAGHRINSWRQGHTKHKKVNEGHVAKELFADYVEEKKLSELEEKKELTEALKTYILCRSEKERIRLRLRLITPTSTLIILDITKTSSNNCLSFTIMNTTKKETAQRISVVWKCKLIKTKGSKPG